MEKTSTISKQKANTWNNKQEQIISKRLHGLHASLDLNSRGTLAMCWIIRNSYPYTALQNRTDPQIPQCTHPTPHNAPSKTGKCACLSRTSHGGTWDRPIMRPARLVIVSAKKQTNMYNGWGWEIKWLFLHIAVYLNHEQTRSALQKEGRINLLNLVT